MLGEYAILMDEIYEVYVNLRDLQREIVFVTKTEEEANKKRIEALGYVTDMLYNILKKRGDPRVKE